MAAAAQFLKLTPAELSLFDRLFTLLDDGNIGSVSGQQVFSLFMMSNVPRPTLATIWNISSQGKIGNLDKNGFFIGCRLIALAQQNLPISQESLMMNKVLPLPMFHGNVQQYYPHEAIQQQQQNIPSKMMPQYMPGIQQQGMMSQQPPMMPQQQQPEMIQQQPSTGVPSQQPLIMQHQQQPSAMQLQQSPMLHPQQSSMMQAQQPPMMQPQQSSMQAQQLPMMQPQQSSMMATQQPPMMQTQEPSMMLQHQMPMMQQSLLPGKHVPALQGNSSVGNALPNQQQRRPSLSSQQIQQAISHERQQQQSQPQPQVMNSNELLPRGVDYLDASPARQPPSGELSSRAQPIAQPVQGNQPAVPIDVNDSLWEITPDKRDTYLKYFDQADADKDGFVNGKEAKAFFTMSKLSSAVLRDIWLLSDIDQDNRLSKEEFTIAMHLTMTVRISGTALPAKLPDQLLRFHQMLTQSAQAIPQQQQPPQLLNQVSNNAPAPVVAKPAVQTAVAPPAAVVKPSGPTADQVAERAEVQRITASAKAQIEEQKIAVQGYQSRCPDYEEETHALRVDAKKLEETLATISEERRQHQALFDKVRAENAAVKADIERINGLIAADNQAYQDFLSKLALGNKELEAARATHAQLLKEAEDLKQRVQDKELAVVCVEQDIEETKKQIDHISEVSSYQMQILNRVSSDYDLKEKQAAELHAARQNLDRIKQAGSPVLNPTFVPAISSSAPVSPLRPDTLWAPSVSTSKTPSVQREEFAFPELNEADFGPSPSIGSNLLKTAPSTISREAVDLTAPPASVPFPARTASADAFQFPVSGAGANKVLFPDSGFDWSGDVSQRPAQTDDFSAKKYDVNPFEEGGWELPPKTIVEGSSDGSNPQISSNSRKQNASAPIEWPTANFDDAPNPPADWAQF